jgi:uncharacterized membrane protein
MMTEEWPTSPACAVRGSSWQAAPDDISPAVEPVVSACPVCGGANAEDAVFCANPACHKALGEFRYVLEEMRAETRWHETLAERVTAFIGRPAFLLIHGLWFALWAAINTGLVRLLHPFDDYPFGLLGIILAVEAIFITGFILISNNRQAAHADKRAELDYEVNVRTYREISAIDRKLQTILDRLEALEGKGGGSGVMAGEVSSGQRVTESTIIDSQTALFGTLRCAAGPDPLPKEEETR